MTILSLEQMLHQSLVLMELDNLLCAFSGLFPEAQILSFSFYYFYQAEQLLHSSWYSS
jgi:hypothetical protein